MFVCPKDGTACPDDLCHGGGCFKMGGYEMIEICEYCGGTIDREIGEYCPCYEDEDLMDYE